jgi:hypothetical protein
MARSSGKVSMKLVTVAVGIPIGIVVRKVVEQIWIATGPNRPHHATDRQVQWADAISWAALTGVGMAVADLLTRKSAEEVYRALLGAEPPASAKPLASRHVRKAEPRYPQAIVPPS